MIFPAQLLAQERHIENKLRIISWKEVRDDKVVRQKSDYSCGAAAIATMLTAHFKNPTTEEQILRVLPTTNRPYSLIDMNKALQSVGYESISLRLQAQELQRIRTPAILFMQPRTARTSVGHFVVLRRIGQASITLADPSLGNRTYSWQEFMKLWAVKTDSKTSEGIIMLVRDSGNPNFHVTEEKKRKDYFFERAEKIIKFRGLGRGFHD